MYVFVVFEKLKCVIDGHVQHIGDICGALCMRVDQFDVEHFIAIARTVTGVAAQIDVA